ncbi:MAG: hypothetical protein ABI193_10225 [Minicystis sp.]
MKLSKNRLILSAIAVPFALTGCAAVIGLDEFSNSAASATGTGGGTTSTTTTGAGGTATTGTGGSAGSTTSTGGSGGTLCVPNTSEECYEGAPSTENVGICRRGMHTCNAEGTHFGECLGQVLPAAEDCTKSDDEDCNGQACSLAIWAKRFPTSGVAYNVKADSLGNVVFTGYFSGTLPLDGAAPLVAAGGDDIFLGKFDTTGNHLWSKRFGDASSQRAAAIAVAANGDIVVTGSFSGSANFGGSLLTSTGEGDVFVARFDTTGNHLWSKRFGDASTQEGLDIAFDSAGNVLVTGQFHGSIDFGNGALSNIGAMSDLFVAKLDGATGNSLWSKSFGDPTGDEGFYAHVATDSADSVILAGNFTKAIKFGGSTLTSQGDYDVYVAKLDAQGNHVWSKRYGDPLAQLLTDMSVNSAGEVVLAGEFSGTINFGMDLTMPVNASGLFLATLDSAGNNMGGKSYKFLATARIAIDPNKNIALAATCFSSGLDLGGDSLGDPGSGMCMAKYDPSENHVWSKMFPGSVDVQVVRSLAVDPMSHGIFITGKPGASIDFGTGPLNGNGNSDIFLAKIAP